MEKKVFISVLMPVNNAADYLANCLDTIIEQSYTNWELIIVNDFSTDDSRAILNSYAHKDARIKILDNIKKGIIPALQLAFNHSKGNYITRMDADDLMPLDKLSFFSKQVDDDPKQIITGKVNYFSEQAISEGYLRYEKWLNDLVESGEFWKNIYRECVIASPNWLAPRSCFKSDFSFSDLSYPEDYDMVFKWYQFGYKIKAIPHITHLWREHPERTSRNVEAYQQKAFFELKTKCFIQLELAEQESVQLIGTGVKGKLVAKELRLNNIPFDCFDFKVKKTNQANGQKNKNRTGSDSVSGVLPLDDLDASVKTILCAWPTNVSVQKEIENYLESKSIFLGVNCWLF